MNDRTGTEGAHQSITPYFTVVGADRLIEFLTTAFGAIVTKESRYDDGSLQHARLRIGNSLVMLNESTDIYPANTSQMHLYVDNTDQAFERALDAGAECLMEPNMRPHGERMAGVTDPCGNIWWIATPRQGSSDSE
ncbi:VOC family protein [Neptunicoccus cionae]|uniref:VOC family protein n=1 Tax=Neptunicoccus cionae TaxID=2035344 RepID=UPI000C77566F|nr:VOC family protein [Amylibacter cionae]PLS21987.1 VOC family protein [Amylibacter cionae]